ncbi:MAG: hypothetical protein IJQ31_05240 [Thermoguttaceae bacterium]|nr:hypothetical protein [Thermoguttaceae bacterium]
MRCDRFGRLVEIVRQKHFQIDDMIIALVFIDEFLRLFLWDPVHDLSKNASSRVYGLLPTKIEIVANSIRVKYRSLGGIRDGQKIFDWTLVKYFFL